MSHPPACKPHKHPILISYFLSITLSLAEFFFVQRHKGSWYQSSLEFLKWHQTLQIYTRTSHGNAAVSWKQFTKGFLVFSPHLTYTFCDTFGHACLIHCFPLVSVTPFSLGFLPSTTTVSSVTPHSSGSSFNCWLYLTFCWAEPQVYKPCTCSALRLKKEPSVSNRGISEWRNLCISSKILEWHPTMLSWWAGRTWWQVLLLGVEGEGEITCYRRKWWQFGSLVTRN